MELLWNTSDYTSGIKEPLLQNAGRIFIACRSKNFRKQIPGLVALVNMQFRLDSYQGNHVFIFCNKIKDSYGTIPMDLFLLNIPVQ